jgi:hypothetical protein
MFRRLLGTLLICVTIVGLFAVVLKFLGIDVRYVF